MANVIVGKFSEISGSSVRHIYDEEGFLLGTISKLDKGGYG